MKRCTFCKLRKEPEEFYKAKDRLSGRLARCKACLKAGGDERRPEDKVCRRCGLKKLKGYFSHIPTSKDGLRTICKRCGLKRDKELREKRAKRLKEIRDNGRF